MKLFQNISIEDFHYELPIDQIAAFPCDIRDQSRLLIREANGVLSEDRFCNIATFLKPGSHVFFNNSRVIQARLIFARSTGAMIEIFCLQPVEPSGYLQSLSSVNSVIWKCMIGNLKRFTTSYIEMRLSFNEIPVILKAEKLHSEGNTGFIKFSWDNNQITFGEILSSAGRIPLPPYIKRAPENIDIERYQTVYSKNNGSVAAPTAGLHFTPNVFEDLERREISIHQVTLHVGAGTFQPVKSKFISGHIMHTEFFELDTKLITLLQEITGKVTCVGTTTLRTLESIYWLGVKLLSNPGNMSGQLSLEQWEPYELPQFYSVEQSLTALERWFKKGSITSTMVATAMIIVPGYTFRTTDTLITNFHQPGSTLLMLVAAFIGDSWKETYHYALTHGFRFLSYGDSSLLFLSQQ